MQTEKQLKCAAVAALREAKHSAESLLTDLDDLILNANTPKSVMPRARKLLAALTKSVHEFNAYHNAANT